MSLDTVRERSSARVAALAIWFGRVDPLPLAGGITNQNFAVEDRGRRYVVRVGNDILVHGVVRANELAASRAAHLAGLGPRVVHAELGILVLDFIEGRTLTPEDIRNPANLERLVEIVRRCHRDIPQHLRGSAAMFWVFHVVRDYAHTLREANSRHVPLLPDLLARAARLEAAVGPIEDDLNEALKRDFEYLADLVRHADKLRPDVRGHLANIILGLLKGEIKRPKHRPTKGATLDERRKIARRVIEVEEKAERKKVAQSVAEVAAEYGCSVTKVWRSLRDYKENERLGRDRWRMEDAMQDYMLDAANEMRREAAVERLTEEHGSDREFTDDEIRDAEHQLDAEWADDDDPGYY